MIETRYDIGYQ